MRESEYAYYKGLALAKLGRQDEADNIFDEMLAAAKPGQADEFFAKFGEKQAHNVRLARTHYRRGLALLGNGDKPQAKAEFEKALELNVSHLWAAVQLSDLSESQN